MQGGSSVFATRYVAPISSGAHKSGATLGDPEVRITMRVGDTVTLIIHRQYMDNTCLFHVFKV